MTKTLQGSNFTITQTSDLAALPWELNEQFIPSTDCVWSSGIRSHRFIAKLADRLHAAETSQHLVVLLTNVTIKRKTYDSVRLYLHISDKQEHYAYGMDEGLTEAASDMLADMFKEQQLASKLMQRIDMLRAEARDQMLARAHRYIEENTKQLADIHAYYCEQKGQNNDTTN